MKERKYVREAFISGELYHLISKMGEMIQVIITSKVTGLAVANVRGKC